MALNFFGLVLKLNRNFLLYLLRTLDGSLLTLKVPEYFISSFMEFLRRGY